MAYRYACGYEHECPFKREPAQETDEPVRRPQWEYDVTELRIAMQRIAKALEAIEQQRAGFYPYYVPAPVPPIYPYPSYPIITCGSHTNSGCENTCSNSQACEHDA